MKLYCLLDSIFLSSIQRIYSLFGSRIDKSRVHQFVKVRLTNYSYFFNLDSLGLVSLNKTEKKKKESLHFITVGHLFIK